MVILVAKLMIPRPEGTTLEQALGQETYVVLRARLRELFAPDKLAHRSEEEQERVRRYWTAGRAIDETTALKGKRAEYGSNLLGQLAADLEIPQRLLYETLKFARAFGILQMSAKLCWSHYRVLLRVPTKRARNFYTKQAKKHGWSVGDLEVHVKGRLFEHTRGDSLAPLEELPKGRLYVYRVVESGGMAKLDLGFRTRLGSAVVSMDELEPGEVAQSRRSRGGDREFEARPIDAKEENLFTYVGSVERVVDGDTLEMRLDLGFGVEVEQTIRLRGIDAPEMSTPEGERAREFVEKALKAAPRVVITTRQQDRYRRWLADVYYRPGWRDGRRILSRGKMLNSELMEVGLASRYRG